MTKRNSRLTAQWKLRLVAVSAGLAGLVAISVAPLTVSLDACHTYCENGDQSNQWCQSAYHTNSDGSTAALNADGEIHDCLQGGCSALHACAPAPNALTPTQVTTVIQAALEEDNPTAVASLFTAQPSSVRLNREREALQVSDCSGVIVANMPATKEFMDRVSMRQATLAR